MQGPQLVHQFHPQAKGILVSLNSDEDYYRARVQEGLDGRYSQTEEAYVGEEGIKGTQFAFIERTYGFIFGWTGLNASEVFQIMDGIIPILIFLTLIWFFRLCGFSRKLSLIGAVIFIILQLYSLNRPVNMRTGFLVMLLSMSCITAGIFKNKLIGIVGGMLLGLCVGIYFWNFSLLWIWWGVWVTVELLELVVSKWSDKSHLSVSNWKILIFIGVIGLAAASPFIMRTIGVMMHPLAEFGVFRSGIHNSRMPESWGYSMAFAFMVVGLALTSHSNFKKLLDYKPAVVTVFAAFIFMHQQVIHGKVLMFVSHSVMSLVFAAICGLLLFLSIRRRWMIITAIGACVYLAAIGYDSRYVISQWIPKQSRFEEQHLSTLLPVLEELPRERILSDVRSSLFLAAHTKHDVVYSIYLKNVLMTHEEIAERFCMTQIPMDSKKREIENRHHLIWPDSNRVFRNSDPGIRAKEIELVLSACERIDADPKGYLEKYGIDYVLWNEKWHPNWDLGRLGIELESIEGGEGWSLWKI
jgi:hypothetical protein